MVCPKPLQYFWQFLDDFRTDKRIDEILAADPKEAINLQAAHPDVVRRLTVILEDYQRTGRSR